MKLAIVIGAILYVALNYALFGLQFLAFPSGSGTYPVWYSCSKIILESLAASAPGFVAGWRYNEGGLKIGALSGMAGVLIGALAVALPFGSPITGELLLGFLAAAFGAALTNGLSGLAAYSIRQTTAN